MECVEGKNGRKGKGGMGDRGEGGRREGKRQIGMEGEGEQGAGGKGRRAHERGEGVQDPSTWPRKPPPVLAESPKGGLGGSR